MNKKMYQSPQMKVMKVQQTEIICSSNPVTSSTSNEQYEEGSTEGWY